MKIIGLVLLSFLFVNIELFANPFIGKWSADEVTVVADDRTLTVTVDSENPFLTPLRGEWPYSYDDQVIRAGNFVAVYEVAPDGDAIMVMCFFPEYVATRMVFWRTAPAFEPNQERSGT